MITRLMITVYQGAARLKFERDLLFLLHDVARLLRVDADKRAHCFTRINLCGQSSG